MVNSNEKLEEIATAVTISYLGSENTPSFGSNTRRGHIAIEEAFQRHEMDLIDLERDFKVSSEFNSIFQPKTT